MKNNISLALAKEQTDPKSLITQYNYNTLNQLTETLYQDGTTESQLYDKVGNVIKKYVYSRNCSSNDPDQYIEYLYDKIYRLKSIEYPALGLNNAIKKVEYNYDNNGNRTKMIEWLDASNKLGEISYSYNNRNWLRDDHL